MFCVLFFLSVFALKKYFRLFSCLYKTTNPAQFKLTNFVKTENCITYFNLVLPVCIIN